MFVVYAGVGQRHLRVLGRVGILRPLLLLFFWIFICIVLQTSVRFEITFLINQTKSLKKKMLVNLGPHCFMENDLVISWNLHLITILFSAGEKNVLNLVYKFLCYNKT